MARKLRRAFGSWQDALSVTAQPSNSPADVLRLQLLEHRATHQWQEAVAAWGRLRDTSAAVVVSTCRRAAEWRWPLRLLAAEPMPELAVAVVKACGHRWQWSLWAIDRCGFAAVSLAVTACKNGRQWQQALHLAASGDIDDVGRAAAIQALPVGRWQLALALAGPHPGPVALASALAACERARRWQQALVLAVEPTLDAVGLTSAMSACVQVTEWERALALAFGHFSHLDGIAWSAVASACQRGDQWELALGMLSELSAPNVAVFGVMLRACRGQRLTAWLLLERMVRQSVPPNATCLAEVLAAWAHASHAAPAVRLAHRQAWAPDARSETRITSVVMAALLQDTDSWDQATRVAYGRSLLVPLREELCRPTGQGVKVANIDAAFLKQEA
ncbi:unnamed protein product, partial [Effrenium voratum]